VAASCHSCLAWGPVGHRGLCKPCAGFASRNPEAGKCGSCGRHQPLKKGHCWLCWCQASLDQPPGQRRRHRGLLGQVRQVRYQQLFFAGMPRRRTLAGIEGPRRRRIDAGPPGIARSQAPPVTLRPRAMWVQLPLFESRRAYRFGWVDLRTDPVPPGPWLAWALHVARTMAQARGWDNAMLRALNRDLVMLLAGYTGEEKIRASDFAAALRGRRHSVARAAEVLHAMGILADDRPAAFDGWLDAQLSGLAPGIAAEAGRWARAARDGAPRTRALHEKSIRIYMASLRPALLEWSTRYGHLREVTRDDIRAQLAAQHGARRHAAAATLRSLFSWAKKNSVVFHDPARHISPGRRDRPILQPLPAGQVSRAANAVTTPHARLCVALAAVHAARPGAIRAMQLSDVDLGNRRLSIAGRPRPLDDLTRQLLQDWLATRQRRWPNTANPHLLINGQTAPGTGPVSPEWLTSLRGLPATLDRLRIDQQLEEALTHGADPLHLAAIFGIDDSTAIRYAASARQLLTRPHENEPPPSPRTHLPATSNHSKPPASSG
jgi:integrase